MENIIKLGLNLAEINLIIQCLTPLPRSDNDISTELLDAMLLARNCLVADDVSSRIEKG